MFIPLILIVVIMYFFMIRPQSKKQKETQRMIDALKKGDKVVTIGGIHGTITQAKEKTVVVKVDDNTKIEFNRTAIATVVFEKAAPAEKKAEGEAVAESAETVAEKTEEQKEAEAKARKYAKVRMIVVLILIVAAIFSLFILPQINGKKAAKADQTQTAAEAPADNEGFDTVKADSNNGDK